MTARFRITTQLFLALACAGLVQPHVANAQTARQPISHEALWLMKRVGTPALSPDGVWAIVSVAEPAYRVQDQVSDLWIVRADGSAPARRLTSTRGGESSVAWSPDSRKIAFTARREGDEATQIYILDVTAGGEAARLTTLSTGARSPRWRPDGGAIAFTSSVFPGTTSDSANARIAKERQALRHRVRVYDAFPIRNWDRWLSDTQPHLFVQSLEGGAAARDLFAGTQLVAAAGFSGRSTSSEAELDAAWTPDGRTLVFVASTGRNRLAFDSDVTSIYRIDANGGEPQPITRSGTSYSDLRFSADGKKLFARAEASDSIVYHHTRLVAFDWPNPGVPTVLTSGFDRSVSSYRFSPDGRTLFLVADDQGYTRLYSMAATGGAVRALAPDSKGTYAGLDVGGRGNTAVVVAQWQSATRPPEVVRVDVANGKHRDLTTFATASAAALDLPPLREFWFTSSRGRRIQNFVALPPAFDETKKYPLFVVMHGGPHSAWLDQWVLRWNYHLLARPGYIVLLTNYTGSTGFSEEFARNIQLDPLAGPAQEINEAADEAIRLYSFVDGTRQAAGGASYGGHLAYWMQASTERYKALIAHAGSINMEAQWGTSDVIYHRELNFGGPVWEQGQVWREQNPIRFAARFRTPMLITVGELDYRVPMNNTLEAWSVLQRLQIPSRLLVFPEENHWIMTGENSRFFYGEVHAWLEKYLKQ